mgnify:CR=1 FL=1
MSNKQLLTSLNRAELEAYLRKIGQPSYRAGQIFRWLYQAGKSQAAEFTDLPLELRQQLEADFIIKKSVVDNIVLEEERNNYFSCLIDKNFYHEKDISNSENKNIEPIVKEYSTNNYTKMKNNLLSGEIFNFYSKYNNDYYITT